LGQIAGKSADLLFVKDLGEFNIDLVIAKGVVAVQGGQLVVEKRPYQYPAWARASIHIKQTVQSSDFKIQTPIDRQVKAHVIGIIENQAPTRHLQAVLDVKDGEVKLDSARDIAKAAVVERHHTSGRIQTGFVSGFGFNISCAVATSVAHDSHHIVIVGTNDEDMHWRLMK
jgi:adenine deaminase